MKTAVWCINFHMLARWTLQPKSLEANFYCPVAYGTMKWERLFLKTAIIRGMEWDKLIMCEVSYEENMGEVEE